MKILSMITLLLIIVGGLNWLLFAFGFNLVSLIFGSVPVLEKLIYILVGISAIVQIPNLKK
jgi:uncharacterized membrane protein YuzA (DUF378 family)